MRKVSCTTLVVLTAILFAGCGKKAPLTEGGSPPTPDNNKQGRSATTQQPVIVSGLSQNINWLVFSPNSTLCVVEGGHGKIVVIRVSDGQKVKEITAYGDPKFSPDGRLLATGDGMGGTQFVEWETGRVQRTLPKARAVWFNRDGSKFAGASMTKEDVSVVTVYSSSNGKTEREFRGGELGTGSGEWIVDVAFHPKDEYIAARTRVGTVSSAVFLWEYQTGKRISLDTHAALNSLGGREQVLFSADGKHLALSGNQIELWELTTRQKVKLLPRQGRGFVELNPDWKHGLWQELLTDKRNNLIAEKVHLLSFPDGKERAVATGKLIDTSTDGKLLLLREGKRLHLYDVQSAKLNRTIDGGESPISAAGFSPNGKTLAIADMRGNLRFEPIGE